MWSLSVARCFNVSRLLDVTRFLNNIAHWLLDVAWLAIVSGCIIDGRAEVRVMRHVLWL